MFPLPRLSRADLSTLPEIIFQSKYPLKEESVPPPPRLSSLLNTLPEMKLQYHINIQNSSLSFTASQAVKSSENVT